MAHHKAQPVEQADYKGFTQRTDGWVACRWNFQTATLKARFVDSGDRKEPEAQISFAIRQFYEKRSAEMVGSLSLTPAQADEMALQIATPALCRKVVMHGWLLSAVETLLDKCESGIRDQLEGTSGFDTAMAELQTYRNLITKVKGDIP